MGLFKKVFGRKEGGTAVGNFLRGAAKVTKGVAGGLANSVIPGAGAIISKLPIGEGLMKLQPSQKSALVNSLTTASQLPAMDHVSAKDYAAQAKRNFIASGVDPNTARILGSSVYEAAAAQPSGASSSAIKNDVLAILNGAKDGALDGFLNNTATGQGVVKDATNNQIQKYLPFALGAAVLFLIIKK